MDNTSGPSVASAQPPGSHTRLRHIHSRLRRPVHTRATHVIHDIHLKTVYNWSHTRSRHTHTHTCRHPYMSLDTHAQTSWTRTPLGLTRTSPTTRTYVLDTTLDVDTVSHTHDVDHTHSGHTRVLDTRIHVRTLHSADSNSRQAPPGP